MLVGQEVRDTLRDCLFADNSVAGDAIIEVPADAVRVEGVMNTYLFDPKGVARNRQKISDMLDQLPDDFHEKKGGGMSFLQACMDREGNHWAEHPTVDDLFVLGQAIGRVSYLLPREVWGALPGGLPYLVVKDK